MIMSDEWNARVRISMRHLNHRNDANPARVKKIKHLHRVLSRRVVQRMYLTRPLRSPISMTINFILIQVISTIRISMHHLIPALLRRILLLIHPWHRWDQHRPPIHSHLQRLLPVDIQHPMHSLRPTTNIRLPHRGWLSPSLSFFNFVDKTFLIAIVVFFFHINIRVKITRNLFFCLVLIDMMLIWQTRHRPTLISQANNPRTRSILRWTLSWFLPWWILIVTNNEFFTHETKAGIEQCLLFSRPIQNLIDENWHVFQLKIFEEWSCSEENEDEKRALSLIS